MIPSDADARAGGPRSTAPRRNLAILPSIVALIGMVAPGSVAGPLRADEPLSGADRLRENRQYFEQSTRPPGLLIPLYSYPTDAAAEAVFGRLIELKRTYPTVPVCAIVSPASGPGAGPIDPNYVNVIDRLRGAGILMVGYVSTRYGKRPLAEVRADADAWRTRYPKVHGLFFDEMANTPDEATVRHYATLTAEAHAAGSWPVVANPGTATPSAFFARSAADVFVIHEEKTWPTERALAGDDAGGSADRPPWTQGVLVHSRPTFDRAELDRVCRHARWVYVTHDTFDAQGDLTDPANNPWDELSRHLEATFLALAR